MNADEHRYDAITEQIVGCAYRVADTLGPGFLEKVYENALAIEIRRCGVSVRQQHPLPVRYRGELVGDFVADLFVADSVLVELKAVRPWMPCTRRKHSII